MSKQQLRNDEHERVFSSGKTRSYRALSSLTQSAIVMALYLALTLTTSFMSFQVIQLRLAEALTALPALFPSAILGVFGGCLLSNLLNPSPLGLVDIIAGSATTLAAACATWFMAKPLRRSLASRLMNDASRDAPVKKRDFLVQKIVALTPPVILNAIVVGTYLPFLISENSPSVWLILGTMGSILLSQAIVVFGLGLPLMTSLERTPWAKRIYLTDK